MSSNDDARLRAPSTAATTHTMELETPDGASYEGRVTGWQIAYDERQDITVYLTEDERLIVHDAGKLRYEVVEDPADLRGWLDDDSYVQALDALGQKATIDL
jgi:hypothetical protein